MVASDKEEEIISKNQNVVSKILPKGKQSLAYLTR
jgi:hypothetical protein